MLAHPILGVSMFMLAITAHKFSCCRRITGAHGREIQKQRDQRRRIQGM
jgi:hypothetical protein